MIKSMTAFARTQSKQQFGSLVWELRSVNHRYLDINMRLSDDLRTSEGRYRELINTKLSRGKIECGLRFKPEIVVESGVEINLEFTKALMHTCEQVHTMLRQASEINVIDVLKWPGVVKESELDIKPVIEASQQLLEQALDELVQNREREGGRLKDLIVQRCDSVEQIVVQVREQMPEIQQKHRQKILDRFEELNAEPDSERLEQELVYLVQKMDVDEELDRLDAHLKELRDVLERDEAIGRRLDFLMQELNREANTLGSKSADIQMTQASVELKVLIEQMREQIQNIE
jgi:uncharacterized protein (TIGR00255 family)